MESTAFIPESKMSSSFAVFRVHTGHESSLTDRGEGVLEGAVLWPFLLSVCIFSWCTWVSASVCVRTCERVYTCMRACAPAWSCNAMGHQ